MQPPEQRRTRWTNLAPALVREGVRAEVKNDVAELWIYDVIDAWGGEWGVSANEVMAALDGVGNVSSISVRLNSPGGDYFEGVAAYNALVRHPANVTVHIDALAASAASVIAMAGDRVVMGQGAQLMIHEASSMAFGTAAEMRAAATMLDQTNDDIAGFYAARAGGDPAQWRAAVAAETWYTAAQAVAAGLADEVASPPAREGVLAAALRAEPCPVRTDVSTYGVPSETDAPQIPAPVAVAVQPDDEPPAAPALPVFDPELIRSAVRKASA